MAPASSSRCPLSVPASRLSPSMARVMSPLLVSKVDTKVVTLSRAARTLASLPSRAALSSREIFCSCSTPPPLSSMDSAPSTSSTSVLRLVRLTGMNAPSDSFPVASAGGGAESSTYFSPSRLDWRSLAPAFAGSLTSPLTSRVTSAVQPSRARLISSTRPTATSLTFTPDCGTRSSTSVNCTFTW